VTRVAYATAAILAAALAFLLGFAFGVDSQRA
jgi:hypothetical protein